MVLCYCHRNRKFVPNLDSRPTTKRANTETIIESYRFMNNQWENGIDAESGVGLKEAFSPMNCSGCMEGMKDGCVFRFKGCRNNPCVRTTWNRDTDAGINMFNSLLWKTLYGDRPRNAQEEIRNKYVMPSQCIRAPICVPFKFTSMAKSIERLPALRLYVCESFVAL